MAKKRTQKQITADQIIKNSLNVMGEQVLTKAREITRIKTHRLYDTYNFRVKPDTTITFTQQLYGKYVTPKNKPSQNSETNALRIIIRKEKIIATEIMIKEIKESILYPFRNK